MIDLWRNRLFFIFFMLPAMTGCRTTGSTATSGFSEIPAAAVYFQLPECLPSCTSADQVALATASPVEKLIVEAIDAAKHTIQFSMYTFSRKPIYEALISAATRGVRIQGIMDRAQFRTTGAFCKPGGCTFSDPFSGPMWEAMGIQEKVVRAASESLFKEGSNTDKLAIVLTNSVGGTGIRPLPGGDRLVHNKYVLVDDKKLLSGSGNWSSTAVSVNLENLITFENEYAPEVISGVACSFKLLWSGDPNLISREISDCQRENLLYLSPAPREDRGPQARILRAINESNSNIAVSMHHLADPDVFAALVAARGRRIEVRLVVDDDDCNGRPEPDFERLVEAGAKVKYIPTTCSIFQLSHSKYGIFDDQTVINGSANWSKAGLRRNYENFVVITSQGAVGSFKGNFERLWDLGQEASACLCDQALAECRVKYCIPERP